MKKLFITTVLISIFSASASWGQKLKVQEVALEEVFVAPVGYDSNDNIEIVIDGKLPSACYDLFQTKIIPKPEKNKFSIKQYIRQKHLTECETEHSDHQGQTFPVQFTTVVSLGELAAGEYRIDYKKASSSSQAVKTFQVSTATAEGIDDHLYAPVSSAFIPELIYSTPNAQVILTGILGNSCMEMNPSDIQVERYGNIFVILPKLKLSSQSETENDCVAMPRPLQQFVSLGEVEAGRYLIHVRSMTGRSVNKTFTVIKKTTNVSAF